MRALLPLLLFISGAAAAADGWPGLAPDCWPGPRMVHGVHELGDLWKRNTHITRRAGGKLPSGGLSPNGGYRFAVEAGQPQGRIVIDAEKDHLVEIRFADIVALTDVRWLNEKLILMRPWWGRIAATDLIFDVEREAFIHAESVTDGTLAYQQYRDRCPAGGCACVKASP